MKKDSENPYSRKSKEKLLTHLRATTNTIETTWPDWKKAYINSSFYIKEKQTQKS